MSKILLVDGYSMLNRGFYALPLLSDKNGIYTNAILGFMNILFKVMEDERPDYLTVALDCHAPTFRHKMFEGYKGTRKPMPAELRMQLPIIREILTSMGILWIEKEGFEADDILGTLAKRSEKEGLEVTLLSGDRDLLQIASENIKISIPKTSAGKTEVYNYHAEDVKREYGVTPSEFIDVKALQGDTSDNIPGVTKVGEKTAQGLIGEYHSLENLYDNIDKITKPALKNNLINDRDQAFLSRKLATIDIDAPIDFDRDSALIRGFINPSSTEILLKYSLKSVITKAEAMGTGNMENAVFAKRYETKYSVVSDFNDSCRILDGIGKDKKFTGLVYLKDKGIAISNSEGCFFVEFYGMFTEGYVRDTYFSGKGPQNIVTYRIKELYPLIGSYTSGLQDIEILAYLIDPVKGDYPVSFLSEHYGERLRAEDKVTAKDPVYYAVSSAEEAYLLFEGLSSKVKSMGMEDLYRNIEMPLSFVLYSMEREGICLDKEKLKEYGDSLNKGIGSLETGIYDLAGTKFNINSPKQLGEILFEKMGLPGGKKTKTGYSTAAEVLEKLAPDHEIVSKILEYRTLTKLKSTYADALAEYVAEDGRIHARFNQTVTATGRLSSDRPNLQNIPIRTELGRELRKVFLPREGYTFIDADYSQIELRLMAHMSGDEGLIQAFKDRADIHRSTASKVFNVPYDEVTSDERRRAKAVNFGIIYGISAFGLSQDIGTDVSVAKQYIEDYFKTYPAVKAYLDKTVSGARETGYTATSYGRLRPVPEIKDSNFNVRSFGERVAMNAPIQGTAADIMKIAMIGIFDEINRRGLRSRLLLQVHDEVLIETLKGEEDEIFDILKDKMEGAVKLSVPLEIDIHKGDSWFDAK